MKILLLVILAVFMTGCIEIVYPVTNDVTQGGGSRMSLWNNDFIGVSPVGGGNVYSQGWSPPSEPTPTYGASGGMLSAGFAPDNPENLDWAPGGLPSQAVQQPVYAPQYFTRPTNNLSPYAMSVLQSLFPSLPQGAAGAPTISWVISPQTTTKDAEGKETATSPANLGSTAAVRPELMSAQTYRRAQASGFMPQFQDYLGMLGQSQDPTAYGQKITAQSEGTTLDSTTSNYLNQLAENYKQSFLQQAQALWPMTDKRSQVNWKVAKQ